MSNSAEPSPSKGSESEPATKNDSTSYEAGDARSTWVATTLRANPDVLALRERTAPLHGQPSLALLSHPAHTEVPDVLGRAHVVGLLVQWMREKGYTSAAAQLVAEAQVPDGPGNGEPQHAKIRRPRAHLPSQGWARTNWCPCCRLVRPTTPLFSPPRQTRSCREPLMM